MVQMMLSAFKLSTNDFLEFTNLELEKLIEITTRLTLNKEPLTSSNLFLQGFKYKRYAEPEFIELVIDQVCVGNIIYLDIYKDDCFRIGLKREFMIFAFLESIANSIKMLNEGGMKVENMNEIRVIVDQINSLLLPLDITVEQLIEYTNILQKTASKVHSKIKSKYTKIWQSFIFMISIKINAYKHIRNIHYMQSFFSEFQFDFMYNNFPMHDRMSDAIFESKVILN
jgi:hypothetical protein